MLLVLPDLSFSIGIHMRKERGKRERKEPEKKEFEEKVIFVNRCAKVLKGGRKFSFSALVVVGNENGLVGYGFAKANELTDSIRKAREDAHKNIITFVRNGSTIPHEVHSKKDGVRILIKPAPEGAGVIAGPKIRAVLELAGVKDAVAKSLGSSNPVNMIRATFKALQSLRSRDEVLKNRGVAT